MDERMIIFKDHEDLVDYLKDLLDTLDGRGMTISDYDMLYEAVNKYA